MKKYNVLIVITFISILVMFFAQSAYDPSVHARMNKMEDESLSDVTATALDLDMNLTVHTVVDTLFRLRDNAGGGTGNSLQFSRVEMDNGTTGTGVNIRTTLSWDLGSSSSKTWIIGTNMTFPYHTNANDSTGMRTLLTRPSVTVGGSQYTIGNTIEISGITSGYDVSSLFGTAVTPALDTTWDTGFLSGWLFISSEGASGGRGLEGYGQQAAYINRIRYQWNDSGAALTASGLYIYGLANEYASGTPGTWSTRMGSARIGGSFPTYNLTSGTPTGAGTEELYMSADVGSGATGAIGSRVRLDIPMAGGIRLRDFTMGTQSFGPLALDGAIFYKQEIQFHQL